MADDPTKRGSPDNRLISLEQEHELDSWSRAFGVSRAKLREAVHAVGHSAQKVRAWLASQPDEG
jgi:hypothetical protein